MRCFSPFVNSVVMACHSEVFRRIPTALHKQMPWSTQTTWSKKELGILHSEDFVQNDRVERREPLIMGESA